MKRSEMRNFESRTSGTSSAEGNLQVAERIGSSTVSEPISYAILQIFNITCLYKEPLKELFTNKDCEDINELNCIQLKINYFKMDH